MRFLLSISYVALLFMLAGPAFADGIQMLPPDTEATTTRCPAGTPRILTWNGSTPLACANNVTASGGNLSATTLNATSAITVTGANGVLNAQALTTLVNLLNTPPCSAGEALTKTGVTTFACINVASNDATAADTTTADNTIPEATPPLDPAPGQCGPAATPVGNSNHVRPYTYWSTCPSQYLCGNGSTASALTIDYNNMAFGSPAWSWTCTPASGGQIVECEVGGAPFPESNIDNINYGACIVSQ